MEVTRRKEMLYVSVLHQLSSTIGRGVIGLLSGVRIGERKKKHFCFFIVYSQSGREISLFCIWIHHSIHQTIRYFYSPQATMCFQFCFDCIVLFYLNLTKSSLWRPFEITFSDLLNTIQQLASCHLLSVNLVTCPAQWNFWYSAITLFTPLRSQIISL